MLANGRREALAEAWERGRAPGSREWWSGVDQRRRERAQARERTGRACRARAPGVWAITCKPSPPSFYPRFKE